MLTGLKPEEAIIGAIIVEPGLITQVKGILNPEHFESYELSQVYEKILKMKEDGDQIDAVTVISKFRHNYGKYISDILEGFPGIGNFGSYRDMVIRDYHERRLKEKLKTGSPNEETIKQITEEWKGIQSLGVRNFDFSQKASEYTSILEKRTTKEEEVFKTGFPTMDYKVPILKRGEMCVVGARTSVGKTSLLLSIMLNMARSGHRVMYVSGEMSFHQIMDRVISIETGIPLLQIRKGQIDGNWPRITSKLSELIEQKIMFVEASGLNFQKFMPQVLTFKPDVLFIDYVQRFTHNGKIESRASFYSDVANGLKGLSVEQNIVIITASQLGRGVEQRKDEPRLSDLKESGGLEESADVVWMIHIPEEQKTEQVKQGKMMILKNRNGPTFQIDCYFDSEVAKFREAE